VRVQSRVTQRYESSHQGLGPGAGPRSPKDPSRVNSGSLRNMGLTVLVLAHALGRLPPRRTAAPRAIS